MTRNTVFVFCVFVFAGVSVIFGQSPCPFGFFRCGRSCYHLSNKTEAWQDAFFECAAFNRGSYLARPDDRQQDASLRACLHKDFIPREEKWIDGTYNWQKKQWVWSSTGEPIIHQSFTRVSPNEFLQWTCAALNPEFSHKWVIRNCYEKKLYICEISA